HQAMKSWKWQRDWPAKPILEKISRTGCVIGLARMTAGNYVKQAQLLFCMKLSSLKWNSKTKGASNENPLRRVFLLFIFGELDASGCTDVAG
ncbi:hypothetical protein, partial [Escherichia coli]|uniref:hypothetical protein n=1 Tax=Escherichia coli TaxID=562 RepID=UPI003F4C0C85